MTVNQLPVWLEELEAEDIEFIHRFILNSGSLKEMAKEYDVSYPTIRLRLDRLIQKISFQNREEDNHVRLIKDLALEGALSFETAKRLITNYHQERK